MRFDQAFSPGRALKHGFEGFKLAPVPLFIGAFIMSITQSGGGGGGNFPSTGSSDYDYDYEFDWDANDFGDYQIGDIQSPVPQLGAGDAGASEPGLAGFFDQPFIPSMQSPSDFMGDFDFSDPAVLGGLVGGLICLACVFVILIGMFVLRSWVQTGYIRLHKQVIETGAGDFSTLFSGSDRLVPMMLWKLLSGLIGMGTIMVAALPGGAVAGVGAVAELPILIPIGAVLAALLVLPVAIYVGLGLYLGTHALVLDEVGPMQALERSWSMARGNRITIFIYGLVMGLAGLVAVFVGLLMCCIGVLFTGPASRAIIDLGLTESYMLATGDDEAAESWRLVEIAGGIY